MKKGEFINGSLPCVILHRTAQQNISQHPFLLFLSLRDTGVWVQDMVNICIEGWRTLSLSIHTSLFLSLSPTLSLALHLSVFQHFGKSPRIKNQLQTLSS